MTEHDIPWKGAAFYSHLLPSLDTPAWDRNRVSGDGWLAVGDAAGFVDPITGEGLYYALRSADLAARSITSGAAYRASVRRDFGQDLEFASRLARRIFHSKFLFGAIPSRMVQFTRRSPSFRAVIQDLFAGVQPYLGLKERLLKNLNGTLFEVCFNRTVR
jgi:flavin-dependent dehydrogenase